MALKIFSIKDKAADAFLLPFFTHNNATAEREFRRLVQDPQSHLFHNPTHFELHCVGIWNDEVGCIISSDSPELVISAEGVRAKEVK